MQVEQLDTLLTLFQTTNREVLATGTSEEDFDRRLKVFFEDCAYLAKRDPQIFGSLTEDDKKTLIAAIRKLLFINVEEGPNLTDRKSVPWTAGCWRELGDERFYWNRYKARLRLELNRSEKVIADIDKVTDEILDNCGDPRDVSKPWQKRGMAIGEVQSGKTGVFAGLMNKAADAGYRVFIVLAGVMNNLRKQTQIRIDRDFLGKESILWNAVETHGSDSIMCMTAVGSDFVKDISKLSIPLSGDRSPAVLLVVKKNKIILNNLKEWLEASNRRRTGRDKIETTLLLVDDEADSASINTNARDKDATAINQAIRDLLGLFTNATYVGFTATPYANIFINPFDENGETDDLFPRNFIRYTSIPSNYFGIRQMLDAVLEHERDHSKPWIVRTIDDAEERLPLKHKKTFAREIKRPGWKLPETLCRALRQFLIINTLLDLRGITNQHRTMMVNVSRYTHVQNALCVKIETVLVNMVSEITQRANSLYGAGSGSELAALREVYEEDFGDQNVDWRAILRQLPYSLQGIKVLAINQSSKDELNYEAYKRDGLRVIAVGGLTLSRGITLEGLCVTYLYRATATYDTLTQMGRWFGYRDGYEDLCRIWLSEDTLDNFERIADAMTDLQAEVEEMKRQNRQPIDFGLKVLNSPGAMAITSRNKMRDSEEVVVQCSFDKYFIETPRIRENENENNKAVTAQLIARLNRSDVQRTLWKGQKAKIWYRNVPGVFVSEFVRDFRADPDSLLLHRFDDSENGLANFIKNNDVPKLQQWDVVVWGKDRVKDDGAPVEVGENVTVSALSRPLRPMPLEDGMYVFEKNHVSGPEVEEVGLDEASLQLLKDNLRSDSESRRRAQRRLFCRKNRSNPLLVIMPVRPEVEGKPSSALPDWIATYAVSFCEFDDGSSRERRLAHYKVNRVWMKAFEDEGDVDE